MIFVFSMIFPCHASMSHLVFLVSRHPSLCALVSCPNMTHHLTHHHHIRNALYVCEKTHISHDSQNHLNRYSDIMTSKDTPDHHTKPPNHHTNNKPIAEAV